VIVVVVVVDRDGDLPLAEHRQHLGHRSGVPSLR